MTRDITVWRLMAHHSDPAAALRWTTQSGRITIGWGAIGDIRTRRFASARDIADAIHVAYPDLQNSGSGGRCLYDLVFTMEKGDLVIVNAEGRRRAVMEVEGEYNFKPAGNNALGDYEHQRAAKVQSIDPDALWREAGSAPFKKYSGRWTLILARKRSTVRRRKVCTQARAMAPGNFAKRNGRVCVD